MLSLVFTLALAAAQPQGAAAAPAPAPAPAAETAKARRARERAIADQKVECREVTLTGTNVPKTACLTKAEWARSRAESLETAQALRDLARETAPRR